MCGFLCWFQKYKIFWPYHAILEVTAHKCLGRKEWKKKRIGGREWKTEEVRRNEEEVEGGENQGEERGRGNGTKDEEGKMKAESLLFLGLTK